MNKRYRLISMIGLIVLVTSTPGCGIINTLRAKDTLNEGVREFNKGKYDEAQKRFERAMQLSPDMTNAQLFYARALNARFEQGLEEDLGLKVVDAYEDIVNRNKNNDKAVEQALAFEAKVYEKLAQNVPDKKAHYVQKQRETLIRQAEHTKNPETQAAAYQFLGASYWNESYYGLSQRYSTYNQPVPPDLVEKMKPLVAKGHEYLDKSLEINPVQPDAWVFKRLLLYEELKYDNNPERKKKIEAQIKQVSDNVTKYRKQLEEQQAAQAAEAEASK